MFPGNFILCGNPTPRLVFDPLILSWKSSPGRKISAAGGFRPAGPIFKFPAAKGDPVGNVNLQVGRGALVRIDFGG